MTTRQTRNKSVRWIGVPFLKKAGTASVALSAGSLLSASFSAQSPSHFPITKGDAAILRFLAAAETLETDLWQQYAELGGKQDERATRTYRRQPALHPRPLGQLDEDMDQYIHDNTEDELTHELFINAYLMSKGAEPVSLDAFRTLPSSRATGAQQIGRLTNLMQLSVDTTWFTRYRARRKNPDLGDKFPQAIPSLAVGSTRNPAH